MKHKESIEKLESLLSALHLLFMKAEYFHRNVEGIHFHAYHGFFEEQYKVIFSLLDPTAERIRALGGYVGENRTDEAILDSQITIKTRAKTMVSLYKEDIDSLTDRLTTTIERLEKTKDIGTVDYLTTMLQTFEKTAWMCSSILTQDDSNSKKGEDDSEDKKPTKEISQKKSETKKINK